MSISISGAQSAINAAFSKASELGIAVCVAVLDEGANLKAFARMDRAWLGAADVAVKKARTSVLFEIDTQSVWEFCKPEGQAHGLEATNGGLVTFAGGIPVRGVDGRLWGAVGVSGGQVEQDAQVAQAAARALSSTSPE